MVVLPAPLGPRKADHLSRRDREADFVHRPDLGVFAPEQALHSCRDAGTPLVDPEMLDEVPRPRRPGSPFWRGTMGLWPQIVAPERVGYPIAHPLIAEAAVPWTK